MIVSEARLAANRANALRSTGPKTEGGKAASRCNALKHGMAGEGVVASEPDKLEVRARAEALEADLAPKSPLGAILLLKMATLSVRAERLAGRETVATARRVRHAVDDHDEGRVEEAERLFGALAEAPRMNLRRLKAMPEGVELLLDAWCELREILTRGGWSAAQLDRAGLMLGVRGEFVDARRFDALGRAARGDFGGLLGHEGAGLDAGGRRGWALGELVARVDAEVAALKAHCETLDFEMIALDRLDAPALALFDHSKEEALARRYESEASRGFFRALKEFRQAEAEFEARAEAASAPPPPPMPALPVASSREMPAPAGPTPSPALPTPLAPEAEAIRRPDLRRLQANRNQRRRR